MGLSIEKRSARRYIYCALPFVSWQFLNTTPSVKHVCVCVVLKLECIYALLQTGAIVTFPNECWLQLSIQNIMVWYSSVLYIVVFSYFDAFKPIDSLYDNTSSAFNPTVHKFPFQTGVSVLFIIFEVNIVKCMEFNDWHHNIMSENCKNNEIAMQGMITTEWIQYLSSSLDIYKKTPRCNNNL